MLALYEWYAYYKDITSDQYIQFKQRSAQRKQQALQENKDESLEIKHQNRFGLRVIAFSLAFIAVLLFILSALTTSGGGIVAVIAVVILLSALIPMRASNKMKVKTVVKAPKTPVNTEKMLNNIN